MQATIHGTTINYDDHGQGPVVLMIQSDQTTRQQWQNEVAPLLEAGFRALLVDLGCLATPIASDPQAQQRCSEQLLGLLDYLGIGRAAICGCSEAGPILRYLMAHHPRRVAGACLADGQSLASPFSRSDDCHPITHTRPAAPEPAARPAARGAIRELNRHLLAFLKALAPHRETDEELEMELDPATSL